MLNLQTGLEAVFSAKSLKKVMSASAYRKSTSLADHGRAIANADQLFRVARLAETAPDNRFSADLVAVHRYEAPMLSDGRVLKVKITVKETVGHTERNKLYTVETIEVGPASVP